MSGTFGTQQIHTGGRGRSILVNADGARYKPGGATIDWSTVSVVQGQNEIVTIDITGSPGGGTFTLTFGGQTTGTIAHNAAADTVEAALEALSTIGNGNVKVSGTNPNFTVEFINDLAKTNVGAITKNAGSLTGGSSPDISINVTQAGAATADLTLADGTVVKAGDKVILAGTTLSKISASGKVGPANTGASDGRQTVDATMRGRSWLLEHDLIYSEVGSEITGALLEAGRVYEDRLQVGGSGQPTLANLRTMFPSILFTKD